MKISNSPRRGAGLASLLFALSIGFSGCDLGSKSVGSGDMLGQVAARELTDTTLDVSAGDPTILSGQLPIKCAAPAAMAAGVTCADSGYKIVYTIRIPETWGMWGPKNIGYFGTPKGGTRIVYDAYFKQSETMEYKENCIGGAVEINTFGSGFSRKAYGYPNGCPQVPTIFKVHGDTIYRPLDASLQRHALNFILSIDRPASIGLVGVVTVRVFK